MTGKTAAYDNWQRRVVEIFHLLAGTVRQAERLVQVAEKSCEFGEKIRLEMDVAQPNLLQVRSSPACARQGNAGSDLSVQLLLAQHCIGSKSSG